MDELRRRLRERQRASGYPLYVGQPVPFIREILAERPWSIQERIAQAVVDHPMVAVPSCFGSGKDWIAARIGAWWVATGGILVATSNSFDQLRDIYWRELKRAHSRGGLPGRPTDGNQLRWEVAESGAFAIGRKPDDNDPEGLQGIHGARVLVVIDEANGVSQALWDATRGLVVNEASRILAIGNPYEPVGPFYAACRLPTWHVIPISVYDTPNFTGEPVAPEAEAALVTPYWVEQRRAEGLEGTPWWQAKVLGQFPDTASNSIIPLAWIEAARTRQHVPDAREWAGLDVAVYGTDDTVLVEGSGNGPEQVSIVHGQDTMATAGMGYGYLTRRRGVLAIDQIGVGQGVHDRIREQRPPGTVLGVNVGQPPDRDPDLYLNLRAQVWWEARQRFDPAGDDPISLIRLPEDVYARIRAEMTAPTYRPTSSGKIQVESKDEMRKRGLSSPDVADALCLALYARSRARRRVAHFGAVA